MSCSICGRSDVQEVNTALRLGGTLGGVAKTFGLPKSTVRRHRIGCLKMTDADLAAIEKQKVDLDAGQSEPEVERVEVESEPCREPVQGDARARVTPHKEAPISAESFEERVLHIADLMARGRYLGRVTASRLAREWNVQRVSVQNLARAAALVCKADRGDIEQAREVSIGAWTDIRRRALRDDDVKGAAMAQAGLDRASGVVEPGGAKVQVLNVMQTPGGQELFGEIRAFIHERDPALLAELDAHLREKIAVRKALTSGVAA